MNELSVISIVCRRCGEDCLDADNFCRSCGLPTNRADRNLPAPQEVVFVPTRRAASLPAEGLSLVTTVLENRGYVLAILLLAGPIGLPALWFSPRFSRVFKMVTTALYFLVTAILPIVVTWYLLDVAVRPLLEPLGN